MKTKAQKLYVHQKTGLVITATKQAAKKLPEDFKPVQFIKNDQGKMVARVRIDGATIDIAERETVEVPQHVNANPN